MLAAILDSIGVTHNCGGTEPRGVGQSIRLNMSSSPGGRTADRANLPERLRRRLLSELNGELRKFPAVLAAASQKPHNR
jgi:hypothetical protein